MRSFRIRLMLTLIAGITVVSLASTYFEVLAHKHLLRVELARRTVWIADTLQPGVEQALAAGKTPDIALQASKARLWAWRYLTRKAAWSSPMDLRIFLECFLPVP